MELGNQITYHQNECITFLKTKERFGGLSNMAGGYPLSVNGIRILTSEALYQVCRFPHKPDLQKIIIGQNSPMTAKMKSKPYRKDSRQDWDKVRVAIMWWCLRVKLAQHWENFGDLLLSTGNAPIVEVSYRDSFWGAKPVNAETLIGINVLGQLLTTLREQIKGSNSDKLQFVEPPALSQFLLINQPIGAIKGLSHKHTPLSASAKETIYDLFSSSNGILPPRDEEIKITHYTSGSLDDSSGIFAPNTSLSSESSCIQLSFNFVK